jgi:hypothetical protein
MTNELLWTAFFLLIALMLVAAVARGVHRVLQRRREGGAPHRHFHDH